MDEFDRSCPVCFETYTDEGDHVPRLLPCTHTACDSCIRKMKKQVVLFCAECKKKHKVPSKSKNFPQNKYILGALKALKDNGDGGGNSSQSEKMQKRFEECTKAGHKRELSLHCVDCAVDICQICMIDDHNGHKIVDIMRQRVQSVSQRIEVLKKQSEHYRKGLNEAKTEVNRTCEKNAELLNKQKEIVGNIFDKIIAQAEENRNVAEDIEIHLSTLKEQCDIIDSVARKINSSGMLNPVDAKLVENAEKSMCENLRLCKYQVYNPMKDPVIGEVFGKLVDEEKCLPKVVVTATFATQIIYCMEVLADGTIVVVERDHSSEGYKLVQYDLTGKSLSSRNIGNTCPFAITEVELEGKLTVAMSYPTQKLIVFCDLKNPSKSFNHSVEPLQPDSMFRISPSTLLYMYNDVIPGVKRLGCLDCSVVPPKPDLRFRVCRLQLDKVLSLCCLQYGEKHLAVTSRDWDTLSAWNLQDDELEWSIKWKVGADKDVMTPCGVTTDGRGHLFLCDTENECIQMFSADGKYLGPIIEAGEQGLGKPWFIYWFEEMSSLIVAHKCNGSEEDFLPSEISVIKTYL